MKESVVFFMCASSPLFTVGRLLFLLLLSLGTSQPVQYPALGLALVGICLPSNKFFVGLIELDPYVVHFFMFPTTI